MNRRQLLKLAAVTGGVSLAPSWLWAAGGPPPGIDRVIAIFLRGGADGLDLVPPLGENRYFDLRPTLSVAESDALPLDGFFGLHPAAGGLKALFDACELAVVHASGLSTPQRSHFSAQAAMEQGIDAADLPAGDGWLGRYLRQIGATDPLAAIALDTAVPKSMSGLNQVLAVGEIDTFDLAVDGLSRSALLAAYAADPMLDPTARAVFDAADGLAPAAALPRGPGYPEGPVGTALADAARLIKAGLGLRAAAVNAGGWDHHDEQAAQMAPLLGSLGDALAAFREDLGPDWDSTAVVVQTEFGRRVAENASGGTDHGHGGVMFVAGGGVVGGQVVSDWPGLAAGELTDGQDLAVTIDYRQVLADLLTARLGIDDPSAVLGGWRPGAPLGLFAGLSGAAAGPFAAG
jgi:uncharacterized protein (DUF1501 family)